MPMAATHDSDNLLALATLGSVT